MDRSQHHFIFSRVEVCSDKLPSPRLGGCRLLVVRLFRRQRPRWAPLGRGQEKDHSRLRSTGGRQLLQRLHLHRRRTRWVRP